MKSSNISQSNDQHHDHHLLPTHMNIKQHNNSGDDDDVDMILYSHGDVPCSLGQQLAGSLFGFLASFIVLLSSTSTVLVVFTVGIVVPIGTKLSATTNSNIFSIDTKNLSRTVTT